MGFTSEFKMDTPTVLASAPARVDLSGGAADMFYGYTLAMAVSLRCRVKAEWSPYSVTLIRGDVEGTIERITPEDAKSFLPWAVLYKLGYAEPRFRIWIRTEIPRSAGLGGSAALAVSLIGAIRYLARGEYDPLEVAEEARDAEGVVMGKRNGWQDWYVSAIGGLLLMDFSPKAEGNKYGIYRDLSTKWKWAVCLLFSGEAHDSAGLNDRLYKAYVRGDSGVRRRIEELNRLTVKGARAIEDGDLMTLAEVVKRNAEIMKDFGRVSRSQAYLMKRAEGLGALACKPCGAGGGGAVACLCKDDEAARYVAEELDGMVVRMDRGLQVVKWW